MKPQIKGFIFDIDGTLLDSNDAHARCLQHAFGEVGYRFEFEQVRVLIGMGLDQIIPRLTALSAESATGKKIAQLKDRFFAQEFDSVRPFPHARDLIAELHERGHRITIATSASGEDLKKFLKKLDIGEFVTEPASSDDADQSKPHPDLVEAALANLGLKPGEAMMVGDTPYDLLAAERAGVASIAFRSGGWSDDSLRRAVTIYDGPAAMLESLRNPARTAEAGANPA